LERHNYIQYITPRKFIRLNAEVQCGRERARYEMPLSLFLESRGHRYLVMLR